MCFGSREDINWLINKMKEKFKIKIEGGLNDFLGCNILREKNENICYILQPHLVKKLTETFGKLLKNRKSTHTPGTPRGIQTRPKEKENIVDSIKHKQFRSGVSSLLYLLKHSRPELSNPIRELSKCMSGPGLNNMKEMWRVING